MSFNFSFVKLNEAVRLNDLRILLSSFQFSKDCVSKECKGVEGNPAWPYDQETSRLAEMAFWPSKDYGMSGLRGKGVG